MMHQWPNNIGLFIAATYIIMKVLKWLILCHFENHSLSEDQCSLMDLNDTFRIFFTFKLQLN